MHVGLCAGIQPLRLTPFDRFEHSGPSLSPESRFGVRPLATGEFRAFDIWAGIDFNRASFTAEKEALREKDVIRFRCVA